MQVIYVLVAVIITIAGIVTVGNAPGSGPLPDLAIIILRNLIRRVYMELVML